jgi:hypothetical protein
MDVSTYQNLITGEHRSQNLFVMFLSTLCQASIDQQDQFAGLPSLFDLDLAVGDQLDKLGAWIGASRNLDQTVLGVDTLPDLSYRFLLKLLVAQNVWDGTIPGAYTLWDSIFGAYGLLIQDNQDMTMTVAFTNPPTDPLVLAVIQEYFGLCPAGVRITGFFQTSVSGVPLFGLDAENPTISGLDVGAWAVEI